MTECCPERHTGGPNSPNNEASTGHSSSSPAMISRNLTSSATSSLGYSPTFPQCNTSALFPHAAHDALNIDGMLSSEERAVRDRVRAYMVSSHKDSLCLCWKANQEQCVCCPSAWIVELLPPPNDWDWLALKIERCFVMSNVFPHACDEICALPQKHETIGPRAFSARVLEHVHGCAT